ncbi:Uncharacterised protein [Salmonella enterica subsp. enterica]|nr:Uncharacterised protein [Salmonella enterica subsp. enterica]
MNRLILREQRIDDINGFTLFIDTADVTHPSGDAQRQAAIVIALLQVQTYRVQQTLRQFLTAIHRDLPGAVFQRGVSETRDQQIRIPFQIGAFRH